MGAWASKFSMGSTFPLVETRLRMGPRSTVVVRTLVGLRREKIGTSIAAAITPATSQFHPLRGDPFRGDPFELWFDANLFSFRVQQEQLPASIYHRKGLEKHGVAQPRVRLDAGRSGFVSFLRTDRSLLRANRVDSADGVRPACHRALVWSCRYNNSMAPTPR